MMRARRMGGDGFNDGAEASVSLAIGGGPLRALGIAFKVMCGCRVRRWLIPWLPRYVSRAGQLTGAEHVDSRIWLIAGCVGL